MKKVLLTGVIVIVFGAYAIFHHTTAPVATKNNESSQSSGTGPTNTSQSNGAFKDGSYTGSAADAFYGTIQVKAVIQNGKITDVQFLQYPNDQPESRQVSQTAMPQLKQEAIQSQTAQVDTISGATQTSQAFKESLADALAQAK